MSPQIWADIIMVGALIAFIAVLARASNVKQGKDRWVCPFCKNTLKSGATICAKCGQHLPALKR